MFRKFLFSLSLTAVSALVVLPARAQVVNSANAYLTCSPTQGSLSVSGGGLPAPDYYTVNYFLNLAPVNGGTNGSISGFHHVVPDSSGDFNTTFSIPGAPTGDWTASGSIFLFDNTNGYVGSCADPLSNGSCFLSVDDKSYVRLNCVAQCTAASTNNSNFNGTAIPAGSYVWFNANFQPQGTFTNGETISLSGASIQIAGQGVNDTVAAPSAIVVFSSSAGCTSTTFNSATNTWRTTVPISSNGQVQDDEIFLDGAVFPVPAGGLPGGINNVVWLGNFSSQSGVSVQWKWGAAVYNTAFTGYHNLDVKAGHQTACGINNGDHAGTPENSAVQQALIGGARGGGGSNFTGSWSGTVSVTPCNNH
jgi:hypothetical protein